VQILTAEENTQKSHHEETRSLYEWEEYCAGSDEASPVSSDLGTGDPF
jgi:hypothetical protein